MLCTFIIVALGMMGNMSYTFAVRYLMFFDYSKKNLKIKINIITFFSKFSEFFCIFGKSLRIWFIFSDGLVLAKPMFSGVLKSFWIIFSNYFWRKWFFIQQTWSESFFLSCLLLQQDSKKKLCHEICILIYNKNKNKKVSCCKNMFNYNFLIAIF